MSNKPTLPPTHQFKGLRTLGSGPDKGRLHREIDALEAKVEALEGQVRALRQSTSWRISSPVRWISARMQRLKGAPDPASVKQEDTYDEWVRLYDSPGEGEHELVRATWAFASESPRISLLLVAKAGLGAELAASATSMLAQSYPNHEVVIAAERSALDELGVEIGSGDVARSRVQLRPRSSGDSAAEVFNSALASSTGDWILLLDPGDRLPTHALSQIVQEIHGHEGTGIIYSDEDELDAQGRRVNPSFKPDWNVDLFYSQNLVSHLAVIRKSLLLEVGGLRGGFDEAAVYDLVLRCLERLDPKQVRHIPRVLCHRRVDRAGAPRSVDVRKSEARALAEHFERTGIAALVVDGADRRRVKYQLPVDAPLVTLIIPTRDAVELLRQCVESIVAATTYPNYEIVLVDNGSTDPVAMAYLAELSAQPGIRVIRDDRPFNYSALNNMAVKQARGQIVGLINNDIEVITPEWLDEMVSLALQPGVGAVGAKLFYPDETVQHAGVLLGVGGETGVAGHAHKLLPAWQGGYMDRALAVQSFSAVTAACLVVRKVLYEQIGGLNEVDLKVAYNDIDFCLRLREAGFRNVWTPYAEMFHHESATRGSDVSDVQRQRFDSEHAFMRQRWGDIISNDPAYNPNLTVHAEDFGLAWPPRVPWRAGAAKA